MKAIEPDKRGEIPQSLVEQAASTMLELAKNFGVDEVLLATRVSEHVQSHHQVVELEKEVPKQILKPAEKKSKNTSSNPVNIFLSELGDKTVEKNGVVSSSVLAFGKQQNASGSTDFIEFGTQGSYGFRVFDALYGADLLHYEAGEAFQSRSNIQFLDKIDRVGEYPPAIMVTRSGNQLAMSAVRHFDESAYARSIGKQARTSRSYYDYRSFSISEEDAKRLTTNKSPWTLAFSRLPQIHTYPTYHSIDKQQSLDLARIQEKPEISSEIFKNQEDFTKLFGLSLLSVSAGQPIFLEQAWSLDEKATFVQMLQQSLTALGSERFISWSSEPIVAVHKKLDVIFRQPGEAMIDPMDKDWAKYKVLKEKNSQLNPLEQRYVEEISGVFANSSAWGQVEENLRDIGQSLWKNIAQKVSVEYEAQSTERISQLVADRNRRLSIVKGIFSSNQDEVSQGFADWICPPGTRELPQYVNLPDSYYVGFKNGEFSGSYTMQDTGLTEARYVLTFLDHNSHGLHNFNSYNKIQRPVFEYMAKNFIKDTGSGISIDVNGFSASLDASAAFERAVSSRGNSNRDIDQLFVSAFGQSDVLTAISSTVSKFQKDQIMFTEGNPLYKKKTWGGFELSPQGKALIQRHFPAGQEKISQVDYLRKWTAFLSEYSSLKNK